MSYFRPGLGALPTQSISQSTGTRTTSSTSLWSKKIASVSALVPRAAQTAPKASNLWSRKVASVSTLAPRVTSTVKPVRPTIAPTSRDKSGTTKPTTMTAPVSTHPASSPGTSSGGGGGASYSGGGGGGGTAWASEAEIGEEIPATPADELDAAPAKKSLSTAAKVGIAAAALLLLAPSFIK